MKMIIEAFLCLVTFGVLVFDVAFIIHYEKATIAARKVNDTARVFSYTKASALCIVASLGVVTAILGIFVLLEGLF